MHTQARLSKIELLVRTFPDDTEDAPWMVEPEYQRLIVEAVASSLRLYLRQHRLGWRIFTDLLVTTPMVGGRLPEVAPDLFVVMADPPQRVSWNVEREGQPPSLVLEVVTQQSAIRDIHQKRWIYQLMGVREYVVYVPRQTSTQPRLFGYRRGAGGEFVDWLPDGDGMLWSEWLGGLGLRPRADWTMLRLVDPTGRPLPTADEEAARAESATIRARVDVALAEAATIRANAEAVRAEAAEAEVARLRAELERREGK